MEDCRTTGKDYLSILLTMYLALAFVLVTLLIASKTVSFHLDAAAIYDTYVVSSLELFPEPLERFLYLLGISLFPLTVLALLPVVFRMLTRVPLDSRLWFRRVAVVTALLGGCWALVTLHRVHYYYLVDRTGGTVAVAALVALPLFLFLRSGNCGSATLHLNRYLLVPGSLLLILFIGLYSTFDLSSVEESAPFEVSFSAVFNAVSMVYLGKQLTVDLTHQYGLYPHFLEPVFRLTGLSILSFTAVMSLLRMVFLLAVYRFLLKIVVNPLIAHLGFASVVFYQFMFATFGVPERFDPYFQFHPVRTLFPALGITLSYLWVTRKSTPLYYANFIIFALGLLWNFDTGFVVLLSWVMLLVFQELCNRNYRAIAKHLVVGAASVAGVSGFFAVAMFIRYGHLPQISQMFIYQNLYYRLGYYMLPMPVVHPWNLLLLLYALALSIACFALRTRRLTVKASMLFYLAVLGLGIFAYYQGRSHDSCLIGVSFPAMALLAMFADHSLTHREEAPLGFGIGLYCALTFWMVCCAGAATNLPTMASDTYIRLERVVNPVDTNIKQKIRFVRENSSPGEKIFIRAYLSGLYYVESGTQPLPTVPARVEMTLKRDHDLITRAISAQMVKKVFHDRGQTYGNNRLEDPFNKTLLSYGYMGRAGRGDPGMYLFTP